MRRYPKVTPVIFLKEPGEASERVAGAVLLVEAETVDGEKVLIVRGLNPLQNVITQLDAGDFSEKFLEWLEPRARAWGATKIMLPWGGAGGFQTNRPGLNLYLCERYKDAPVVTLKRSLDVLFNGYDITQECRVIRDLGPVVH
jgi:hypothetical protein